MTVNGTAPQPADNGWDNFWRTASGGAYSSNGISHPLVQAFWADFFAHTKSDGATPALLDVASGNGAVAALACAESSGPTGTVYCVDSSMAALTALRKRLPTVHGVIADAARLPFPAARFDIATSLFGVEYAGHRAFDEMLRVVAPRGRIGLVLHHHESSICRDSSASLRAVRGVQRSGFTALAAELFKTGCDAARGADRRAYDEAARRLSPSARAIESMLHEQGEHVADGLVARLYNDVADIHQQIARYEPDAVLAWLDAIEHEIAAYAGRMASMCAAAVDSQRFDDMCRQLIVAGWQVCSALPLQVRGEASPLAWGLVANRPAG